MRSISKNQSGSTIVESMIVLVIVTIWLAGTYELLQWGVKLASSTESRIQAINIAREGIEAVENIRNTNWIKFSSDLENCFDVADYDSSCIGSALAPKLTTNAAKVVTNQNGTWRLASYTWSGVTYDQSWLTAQYDAGASLPPCNAGRPVNCRTKFFRTVTVTDIGSPWAKKMRVRSTVTWRDASRTNPYVIELEEILTNWKPNF